MRCLVLLCLTLALGGCAKERTRPISTASRALTREQATQLLLHEGYRDIGHLRRNGEDWIGTATKYGNVATFDIDNTGHINLIPPQR